MQLESAQRKQDHKADGAGIQGKGHGRIKPFALKPAVLLIKQELNGEQKRRKDQNQIHNILVASQLLSDFAFSISHFRLTS